MIRYFLYVMLWVWDNVSLTSASQLRAVQDQAVAAFNEGRYEAAAAYYRRIVEGSVLSDPLSRMNMANSYYMAGKKDQAQKSYLLLTRVSDPALASMAHVQLAQLAIEEMDTVAALSRLRQAIMLDRSNKLSVMNYEVLSSRFSGSEPAKVLKSEIREIPRETEKLREETPAEPDEREGLLAEVSDQKRQLLQNLDKINMTEEQVQSILDAMKTNEMQYIYQLRKLDGKNTGSQDKEIAW